MQELKKILKNRKCLGIKCHIKKIHEKYSTKDKNNKKKYKKMSTNCDFTFLNNNEISRELVSV